MTYWVKISSNWFGHFQVPVCPEISNLQIIQDMNTNTYIYTVSEFAKWQKFINSYLKSAF